MLAAIPNPGSGETHPGVLGIRSSQLSLDYLVLTTVPKSCSGDGVLLINCIRTVWLRCNIAHIMS